MWLCLETGSLRSYMCAHTCSVASVMSTLCDPMDCSPPGSSVHEILQARILEWIACPPPGDLPDPGIEPTSLMSPALAGRLFTTSAAWEAWSNRTGVLIRRDAEKKSSIRTQWDSSHLQARKRIPTRNQHCLYLDLELLTSRVWKNGMLFLNGKIHNGITLMSTWNYHNIVNRLYSNIK